MFTDNQGMNVGRSVQHPRVALQLHSQEEGCICIHSVTHRYYRGTLCRVSIVFVFLAYFVFFWFT